MRRRIYVTRYDEEKKLNFFKVDYILGDFHAVVKMKSRRELEAFVLENGGRNIFENRDAYFVIAGGVLFLAEKKPRKRKEKELVMWF